MSARTDMSMKNAKEVTVMEKTCERRHPKECRKYSNSKCRFNKDCAYKHLENLQTSTYQTQVNEAVANVTIQHEKEIKELHSEMYGLKNKIEKMVNQIKSLENMVKENSEGQSEIKVLNTAVSQTLQEASPIEENNQGEEPWLHCPVCSQKFKTKKTMQNHQKTMHNKIKFCNKCSESFSSKKALETHLSEVHSKKQTENHTKCKESKVSKVCELCPYVYKTDGELKYHMLIDHKFEICGDCGKIISTKTLLVKHMETEHTSTIANGDLDVSLNKERL